MGMGKGKIPHGFLHDPGAEAVQHAHPQPLEFTAVDPADRLASEDAGLV